MSSREFSSPEARRSLSVISEQVNTDRLFKLLQRSSGLVFDSKFGIDQEFPGLAKYAAIYAYRGLAVNGYAKEATEEVTKLHKRNPAVLTNQNPLTRKLKDFFNSFGW